MYKISSVNYTALNSYVSKMVSPQNCDENKPGILRNEEGSPSASPQPSWIKGVHIVRHHKANQQTLWYVYAWRGGPQVLRIYNHERPVLTPDLLADIKRHLDERSAASDPDDPTGKTLAWLIDLWKESPEWAQMTRNTRKTWGSALNVIRGRWGREPVHNFYDEGSKLKVIKWRNSRRETPRAADTGVSVLRSLLKFGGPYVGSSVNVAADVGRLYDDGNRPEIIWTDEDIARFVDKAEELGLSAAGDAVRLAALTGLRRADLVSLSHAHLREHTIVKRTKKRTKRKRPSAAIPRLPELNALLNELSTRPRCPGAETLLVDDTGAPWAPDSLTRAVQVIRDELGLVHLDHDDLDDAGLPRARKKHFHDLRGTFITRLITQLDLSDVEIADIMGWSSERVSNIRKFYVDQGAYVAALVARRSNLSPSGSV